MSKRLTQEEFEKKIHNKYGEKFKVISNYQTVKINVKLKCNNCGFEFSRTPSCLYSSNVVCPLCEKQKSSVGAIRGVNDIWTTAPNVATLLLNKEDGYNHRLHSKTKLMFVCPDCNNSSPNLATNIFYRGMSCPYCSDGISYPNRFIRNILKLLNIKFISEYKICNYNYSYDIYFQYMNKHYLIEMDGGYGHGKRETPQYSIDEQIRIDKDKDSIAQKHGYTMIRIDCDYLDVVDRKNYIIENIKKSKINELFNITSEIYELADLKSQKSNVIQFGELWNSGICSYEILMDELNVKAKSTIRNYGKLCIDLNIINCNYKQLLNILNKNSIDNLMPHRGQPVKCVQTKQCFGSMSIAERELKICHIDRFFSGKYLYSGKLKDGTRLTWEKISRDEYKNYLLNKTKSVS